MKVKELIKELQKMEQDANVYYRKGKTLHAVTMARPTLGAESFLVELLNPESEHIR